MAAKHLHDALDEIPDTGEIVVRMPERHDGDEMVEAWRSARREANAALELWSRAGGRRAFSVFRAAEDRADAAQDALAAR